VNDPNASREAQVEEASAQLSAGLKSCRSVVENYRHMLVGKEKPAPQDVAAANDDDSLAGQQTSGSDGTSA
jgi:hypothetical protein